MKKLLNEIIAIIDEGKKNVEDVSAYNREIMFFQILTEIRATCKGAIAVMEENEPSGQNFG